MNAEKIILDKVEENRQQIIDFVQKIVQIPSLSGEEFEIGQALKKGMEDWGLEDVEVVEKVPKHPNLLARVNGKADGPTLVFNGHMDVIAPGDESQWTYPPYSGAIVDGNLYGRGTVDMKTSTCTMMLASAILKKTNLPLNGNILVTVVCDEEILSLIHIYRIVAHRLKKLVKEALGLLTKYLFTIKLIWKFSCAF